MSFFNSFHWPLHAQRGITSRARYEDKIDVHLAKLDIQNMIIQQTRQTHPYYAVDSITCTVQNEIL
jgi:transposase